MKENKTNKGQLNNEEQDKSKNNSVSGLSRRDFLGRAGTAGILGAGILAFPNLLAKSGLGVAQNKGSYSVCSGGCEIVPKSGTARADMAFEIRYAAAKYERDMPIPIHPCNGDETAYSDRNFFASFTKGLKRSEVPAERERGEVDSGEYCKLLHAFQTGNPNDFEMVMLGFSNECRDVAFSKAESSLSADAFEPLRQRRLETPQAGLNYDLEGKDYYQLINRNPQSTDPAVAFPPAFRFDSKQEATEIIENYWQALTRDVPFIKYETHPDIVTASADLNNFKAYYYGPLDTSGNISPRVFSRGILPGDKKGPYLSQFFLRDIPYGVQTIPAKIKSPSQTKDNNFMTYPKEWFKIQTGQTPDKKTIFDTTPRYIRSGRDLAEYVHNDAIYQPYLNAALIMLAMPASGGLGVPVNPRNPYDHTNGGYCKQNNFVEFGPSQLLSLLGEVSVRAHKAVWYQKWCVHRRLRPEEFGGRIHYNQASPVDPPIYPVNSIIYNSNVLSLTHSIYGTYFLPQAFPEGSPMHPAYGAGHATLAGACVTILKAWFNSFLPYADFGPIYQPSEDGLSLIPSSSETADILVADELDKLASNVSIGRNIAGVHWRSDYTESVFLGEQVAIQLLEDWGYTYNEEFLGFKFRNFSGENIEVGAKKSV